MAVVLIFGGAAVALVLASRWLQYANMMRIGRAAVRAVVTPLAPDELPVPARAELPPLEALGFRVRATSRTDLGTLPPERTAHLTDDTNVTVMRSMGVEGHDEGGASVVAVSWYPGGFLATSRAASMSVQPGEVLQAFPGVDSGQVAVRHREAIAALEQHGARPLALPADLLPRLQGDWHADGAAILGASFFTRLAWSSRFASAAKRATPIAARPDIAAIAAQLAAPSSAPI
jgi:hypothetical protein